MQSHLKSLIHSSPNYHIKVPKAKLWPQQCHTFKSPSKSAWHLAQEGETVLEVFERFFRMYLKKVSPYNLINRRE